MSWDVRIAVKRNEDDEEPYTMRLSYLHTEGATYNIFGSDRADLNVTYNYGSLFYKAIGSSFKCLNGMTVKEALPLLEKGCCQLPDSPSNDYWVATEGNAGHALHIIKTWVVQALDQRLDAYLQIV